MEDGDRAELRLGILGAGTMGSGIALAALYNGIRVKLFDVAESALAQAVHYAEQHLLRKGLEGNLDLLQRSLRLQDLADSTVVIEAVTEDLSVKRDIFRKLDQICPPPAILATNTSTLSITAVAASVGSAERVGGMHFFNPAAVLPLVEVVRGAATSDATVESLMNLAERLGKTPVLTRDTPGFIVNRVARPFYGEALRLLGEGAARHDQIDKIVEQGGGFVMGPFRLMDLIGIDVNLAASKSIYEQSFGEPRYRPHWIQEQKVLQNALGRKTGHGFYAYGEAAPEPETLETPTAGGGSGLMLVSSGSWAPGLPEALLNAGYSLSETHGDVPRAAWVIASRDEGLKEQVRRFDRGLSREIPLLCQAADATVGEIAGWMEHPDRLVGFDGLFFDAGSTVTLVEGAILRLEIRQNVEELLRTMGRRSMWLDDSPALVLPRVLAMLANEAAFAVGEGVADADTIDTAMKLGMRYPDGPLNWARRIGYGRILEVLEHLRREYGEERYRPAPQLRRWARSELLASE